MGVRDSIEKNVPAVLRAEGPIFGIVPDVRLIPGLLWIVIVMGGSLVTMFLYSFVTDPLGGDFTVTFEYYQRFLNEPLYQLIMLDSIVIALKTTLGTLIIGYPLAYYMVIHSNHRNLLLLLVIAPIWTNEVVRTYAWILILESNGLVNWVLVDFLGVLDNPLKLMFTQDAVVIGLIHPLLPYMIIPLVAGLMSVDVSEIEAAKNLGATKLQAFYEVTLPQTASGIAAGATFVFVLSSGAYLAPILLGGAENNMIANFIGLMFGRGQNWNFGSVLAVVYSLLIVFLFVVVSRFANVQISATASIEGEDE